MKARIVWADPVRDLAFSLPMEDQQEIFGQIALLARRPHPLNREHNERNN